ncbi:hypothetical protein CLF_107428 [Clonorchis sinensis]|uniref:Uncharacterized protein n=1 Tax=Clonorchis sinensis TaxID=79923 RepID=G7YGT0_CLOSI|nr:hypothetical protein CLF_107428 [Clonorchis sinensis]
MTLRQEIEFAGNTPHSSDLSGNGEVVWQLGIKRVLQLNDYYYYYHIAASPQRSDPTVPFAAPQECPSIEINFISRQHVDHMGTTNGQWVITGNVKTIRYKLNGSEFRRIGVHFDAKQASRPYNDRSLVDYGEFEYRRVYARTTTEIRTTWCGIGSGYWEGIGYLVHIFDQWALGLMLGREAFRLLTNHMRFVDLIPETSVDEKRKAKTSKSIDDVDVSLLIRTSGHVAIDVRIRFLQSIPSNAIPTSNL